MYTIQEPTMAPPKFLPSNPEPLKTWLDLGVYVVFPHSDQRGLGTPAATGLL